MGSSFTYTPLIWFPVLSIGILIIVSVYSWHHRQVAGARWFSVVTALGVLWSAGAVMEFLAVEPSAKVFWVRYQGIWPLVIATCMFCFVLEYANLGRWLTPRNLILLAIPPLLALVLVMTNDLHHLAWKVYIIESGEKPSIGVAAWIMFVYGYLLGVAGIVILISLFIRSPRQRWPIALLVTGQIITRIAFFLDYTYLPLFGTIETTLLAFTVTSGLYALALFGFGMFDPVPLARSMVIEQMRDGMLVLDTQRLVVDLNPAAEKILGGRSLELRGQLVDRIIPGCPSEFYSTDRPGEELEVTLGAEQDLRNYALHCSPLTDKRGKVHGCLILMQDVTEQKQAQAQLVGQQRALAVLHERDHLARELHDSLGQMLGYVSMQAQAIRKLLQRGETRSAEQQLDRLIDAARKAHTDLRESILSLKVDMNAQWSFFDMLRRQADFYEQNYNISTNLIVPATLSEGAFGDEQSVQLLRVIQEAMTNAHVHGQARRVQVIFELSPGVSPDGSMVQVKIIDDGCGFDANQIIHQDGGKTGNHFGLAFMSQRMAEIGGSMSVTSRPAQGTQVLLQVPLQNPLMEVR